MPTENEIAITERFNFFNNSSFAETILIRAVMQMPLIDDRRSKLQINFEHFFLKYYAKKILRPKKNSALWSVRPSYLRHCMNVRAAIDCKSIQLSGLNSLFALVL
jgi:hypothetical protein